jgi:hypothetical protein
VADANVAQSVRGGAVTEAALGDQGWMTSFRGMGFENVSKNTSEQGVCLFARLASGVFLRNRLETG